MRWLSAAKMQGRATRLTTSCHPLRPAAVCHPNHHLTIRLRRSRRQRMKRRCEGPPLRPYHRWCPEEVLPHSQRDVPEKKRLERPPLSYQTVVVPTSHILSFFLFLSLPSLQKSTHRRLSGHTWRHGRKRVSRIKEPTLTDASKVKGGKLSGEAFFFDVATVK